MKQIMKEKKEARRQEFLRAEAIRKKKEAEDAEVEALEAEARGDFDRMHPALRSYMTLKKSSKKGIQKVYDLYQESEDKIKSGKQRLLEEERLRREKMLALIHRLKNPKPVEKVKYKNMQQVLDESNQRKEKMNQLWNGIDPPPESSSEEETPPKYHPALNKRPLFRDEFVDEDLFPSTYLPNSTRAKVNPQKLPSIHFSKN